MFNLWENIPAELPAELVQTLCSHRRVRIERIVSRGHASPAGFWYDQPQHEFVVLLSGAARLQFENEAIDLRPGSCLNIPAHRRHRLEWTTPAEPTLWLAVHYDD